MTACPPIGRSDHAWNGRKPLRVHMWNGRDLFGRLIRYFTCEMVRAPEMVDPEAAWRYAIPWSHPEAQACATRQPPDRL